jgi:asparagine synthase (glutamine-hydrolysing)
VCGIAGFAGFPERGDQARALVSSMCDAIVHRGPDGEGVGVYEHVALGMRRLSIIDVDGGWQPIGNEDGTVQIVFNGEIYNHRVLRRELELKGHQFRTHSDTETIVHGYEERGARVVDSLRGMFGFAIWDTRRQQLVLARDRFGQKPLYIWEHDGGIAFASELKSLLRLPRFRPQINREAMLRYLALGYVPDPMSIYAGVRKLAPGTVLVWTPGEGSRETRYWSPIQPQLERIDEREAAEELRRRLADAVLCHLESDVPLGAFLSGGVDSTAVVAQMAQLAGGRVKTFTIGFDDPRFNEAPAARAVAAELGTEHTELIVRPDAGLLIDTLALQFDEPFADSSALPTYLVSKLAREHVTVALSGDGGDELFGGYGRYQRVRRPRVHSRALSGTMSRIARALPHGAYGRNYLLNLTRSERGRYASTVAFPLSTEEGGLVRRERVPAAVDLEGLLAPQFEECREHDFFAQMGLVDVMSYLPGDILTKVDRMSMAVSLEARVPLLDHEFAEFALSLPSSLKVRDGRGKYIFRKALAGLVPDSVFTRPKTGFSVPLGAWFRGPLRHRIEALRDPNAPVREHVDGDAVERHLAEHLASRRDHSHALWRLLVLDVWLRHHNAIALA